MINNMKQSNKSAAEIAHERVMNMPIHPEYEPVENLPIPYWKGIIVKETKVPLSVKKVGDINLFTGGTRAENTIPERQGIIMAVGPQCSEYMRIGIKIQFSSYVDTFFIHNGETYAKMDETSVHFFIPDPATRVDNGVKSSKQVLREKRSSQQESRTARENQRDQNDLDKKNDKTKGRIRPVR